MSVLVLLLLLASLAATASSHTCPPLPNTHSWTWDLLSRWSTASAPSASVNSQSLLPSLSAMTANDELCTIPRRWDLSPVEFSSTYRAKAPVILSSSSLRQRNAHFRNQTQLAALQQQLGDQHVTLSSANAISHDKLHVPFNTFVENMLQPATPIDATLKRANESWYLFGDHDPDVWDHLLDLYHAPDEFIDALAYKSLSFGIGPSGSGVPLHIHGPVFAEVLHGHKLWFLTPPDDKPEFDPDETSLLWYLRELRHLPPERRPLMCLCAAGDVLYIPGAWWHATLNIGRTVFISTFVTEGDSMLN